MHKAWLVFLAVVMTVVAFSGPLGAQELPKPQGYVNDFAGVIPPDQRERLQKLSQELKQKTDAELVVVTMPTIGGEDATEYANKLFASWGMGEKSKNNGVLVFLALKERQIRVEVGYGLEGILPDGLVGGVLDTYAFLFLRCPREGSNQEPSLPHAFRRGAPASENRGYGVWDKGS
jgi:uncharacterized protein